MRIAATVIRKTTIRKMNYSENELARNEEEEWYTYLIWFARFLLPE